MPGKLKRNLSTPELVRWWAAVEEAAKTAPKLIWKEKKSEAELDAN